MKKQILSITVLALLFSCKSNLDCNDTTVKNMVKELQIELETENQKRAISLFKISPEEINHLITNYAVIKNVRTTNKDNDLKKCDCTGELSFNVSDITKAKLKSKGVLNTARYYLESDLLDIESIRVNYNLQETEEGELFTETEEITGFRAFLILLNSHLADEEKYVAEFSYH